MAKRKVSSDRLEKIKQRLKREKLGSDSSFWKPKQGDNQIRILPGVGDMDEVFFVYVGTHFLEHAPKQWKSWLCPKETFEGACPICEYVAALKATGDEDDKELADNLRAQRTWPMNVIVREEEEKGPQIFHAKVTMMRQIQAMIMDAEYGELIIDVDKGLDIRITRSGKGRQTTYDLSARRRETPLSEDPDQIDTWLDKAMDLTPIELSEDPEEDRELYSDEDGNALYVFGVAPYERIRVEFEGLEEEDEDDWEDDEDDWEDDEDEGVAAAKEAISRRRAAKSPKKSTRTPRRRRR